MTEVTEGAPEGMNDSGTCTPVDPKLTQPRSWPVLRASMIKRREIEGAESPKGRALSNLIEMGDNAETYVRPSWATDRRQALPYFMEREAARLGGM